MTNQNLCQPEKLDYVPLEVLVEEQEKHRVEWLKARAEAIDEWIKFMMPKLYEQNKAITEELARLFAVMCLQEGRML